MFYILAASRSRIRFSRKPQVYAHGAHREVIHGVLGLTSSRAGSVKNISNPFINAVSQGLLNHNLFALKLAQPGHLTIGDIDYNQFSGEIMRIPRTNNPSSLLAEGRWQVDAKYLAVGPTPMDKFSLEGYTASFTTKWPYIYLPKQLAWDLIIGLGFEEWGMFIPASVDCGLRYSMSNVTINLGGHSLVLDTI